LDEAEPQKFINNLGRAYMNPMCAFKDAALAIPSTPTIMWDYSLGFTALAVIPDGPEGPATFFVPLLVSTFLLICLLAYGLSSSNLI
jgi:hypothetical protein